MDMKGVRVTKAGKEIIGEPEPGRYYRVEVVAGDVKAAAKEMKKRYPKSFFTFRDIGGRQSLAADSPAPDAGEPKAKAK